MYDWLDTVAERDLTALGDLPRPGQSTRLTDDQWRELTATLAASPSEAGYDEPTWTPALVRDYIAETFKVEYSLAHMYRVMKRSSEWFGNATPLNILPLWWVRRELSGRGGATDSHGHTECSGVNSS